MARRPSVRYYSSRGKFYCQHEGKQHCLGDGPDDFPNGPQYQAAVQAFGKLMLGQPTRDKADNNTVEQILKQWVERFVSGLSEQSKVTTVAVIHPFIAAHGNVPVGKLTPEMVEDFIKLMRKPRTCTTQTYRTFAWGDAATACFIVKLKQAFIWARDRNLMTVDPLKTIKPPPVKTRSRLTPATAETYKVVLAAAMKQPVKDLICCLYFTGCRPSELLNAKASCWNDAKQTITYYGDDRRRDGEFRHKTASQNKDRVIYFPSEAAEVVRRLIIPHPTGYLFRSTTGEPWTQGGVNHAFERLRRFTGIEDLIPYSFRHGFCTRWLLDGGNINVLGELLGNSPKMILKHYAHLIAGRDKIHSQVDAFFAS